ncbi:hypothetical protein KR093_001955 [Drosophila rubida]|uniref:Peptidase S1 domain-containing protein n=1 Tax=Drosophila rubida TaxID=30044 RepID=A0AAD4PQC4_9MUSC|nr:hypothetical protein KR093_001955 [Drosophila rubida]
MKLYFTTIILICCEQFAKTIAQGMPISPCPKMFQYRFDGVEWFGLIAVRNPEVHGLQLRVILSMRGKPTTRITNIFTQNYLGEIELLTRGQFTSNAPVLYKIRFPKHHFPPKLVLISTNNRVICFGSADHSIFMTQIQLEHTRKLSFIPDKKSSSLIVPAGTASNVESVKAVGKEMPANHDFGSKQLPHIQFKKKPFHSKGEICGKIDTSFDFRLPKSDLNDESRFSSASAEDSNQSPIFVSPGDYDNYDGDHVLDEVEVAEDDSVILVDGQSTMTTTSNTLPSLTRGAWPWLAAIYVNNITSLDFQCCGTLVSSRVVISSAHCFQMFKHRLTANEVLVFLGRHNLKNWNEEGSLAAPVDSIYIHSDYNQQISDYDADIAVLILKDEVRFNTFIQPVCLWSGSSKSEYIVGEHGIVIGWSFDRTATNSTQHNASNDADANNSKPKVLKAPIVSNEVCVKANADFKSLLSSRTFCAAILVDTSTQRQGGHAIHTGISGAGLMIMKNNRWMLRGTVSAALPSGLNGSPSSSSNGDDSDRCCGGQYLIYADVAKFIDWITAFII